MASSSTEQGKKRKSGDLIYEVIDEINSSQVEVNPDEQPAKFLKLSIEDSPAKTKTYDTNLEIEKIDNSTANLENVQDINMPGSAEMKESPVSAVETTDAVNRTISEEAADESVILIEEKVDVIDLDTTVEVLSQPEKETLEDTNNETLKDSQESTEVPDKPEIYIEFKDASVENVYKAQFLQFLLKFKELDVSIESFSLKITKKPNAPLESDVLEVPSDGEVADHNKSGKKRKKKSKAKKELFVLDTKPQAHNESSQQIYDRKFSILHEDDKVQKSEKSSAQTCFNCDKEHSLKDCPEPRNYAKINAARQKMNSKGKSARYHLEEDQKFSHLLPGKITDNLKVALGLKSNELPPYIYGMRVLGYPPGWLEEAKFVNSDMNLFGIDGKNVKSDSKNKQGLDASRIVDYPGFNAPLLKGTFDDHQFYDVTPYSEECSKENMINFFKKQIAVQEDDLEMRDMELDQDTTVNSECLDTSIDLRAKINKLHQPSDSPSLTELEKQKQKILAQLDDSVITIASETQDNVENDDKLEKIQNSEEIIPEANTSNNSNTDEDSPLNSSVRNIKTSSFGTPIIKSASPYSRLPNPDNFSVGVSPVIDFENLPNSTGKYEQMTGVLQKVRSTLKTIQS